jgi:hypothetical protein
MAPTIRDRIKRRFRWPQALMTGGILVLILLRLSIRLHWDSMPAVLLLAIAGGVGVIALLIGMTLMFFSIKCPNCGGNLRNEAYRISRAWGKRVDFCPYCGIGLDQPLAPRVS